MKQSLAENLGQLKSVIINESNKSTQYMEDLQAIISAGNTRIEVAASKLERSAITIEKGVLPVSLSHERPGPLSRRVGNHSSRKAMAYQGLRKDIRQLTTLMRELSVVNARPRSAIIYSGGSHQSLLLSLLLMKPLLDGAIASLGMDQELQFPPGYLSWVSAQFEILLSSVLRNVDDLSTNEDPFGTRRPSYEPGIHPTSSKGHQSSEKRPRVLQTGRPRTVVFKRPVRRAWQFESSVGQLRICNTMSYPLHDAEGFDGYNTDIELIFQPNRTVHSTVVVAKLGEQSVTAMVPQIERQLHSYIQISYEDSRELYDLIGYGTIHEIDEAFRSSRHSPYVIDFNGRSIHYV